MALASFPARMRTSKVAFMLMISFSVDWDSRGWSRAYGVAWPGENGKQMASALSCPLR